MTTTSYQRGLVAEAMCQWYLRFKFYQILTKRFKSKRGEVDIIAVRGKTLAVIEVKTRLTADEALESVEPRRHKRIHRAALDFIAHNPQFNGHNMRFDVMLVTPRRLPVYMKDAWRPEN